MKIKSVDALFWTGYDISEKTKSEIKSLCRMGINELRAKYCEVYGYNSGARNKDFLVRKIAWKLQSIETKSDIKPATREKAYLIADFSRLKLNRAKKSPVELVVGRDFAKRKLELGRDPRLPMPGALLSKTFRGKQHLVKVLDKGFEYENENFKTLSSVAKKIAGTNWNGFKFFNL